MNIQVRRANERGRADYGWLRTQYTFSFADYYDPRWMGFRSLRVINDDWVDPSQGFGMHPHRNMEIFSYILEGELQHRDSLGNGRSLRPGQIQLMSAGHGVRHSEFNPSPDQPVHLLQIWIEPRTLGLTPGYTEWHPQPIHDGVAKLLVISPDGREGSALIHQDAEIYRVRLGAGESITHQLRPGRGIWLHVASGELRCNQVTLQTGDGAYSEDSGTVQLEADAPSEAILFDLA
jgi:hypothetical protein